LLLNLVQPTKQYLIKAVSYTEGELVRQLQLHEEQAFQFLYDNYSKALFTVIYQVVPDQAQAEDLLQQVFVKIWKNITTYDASKGRLFTWMLKHRPQRGY
jgi:DNA-directed RNA polymerase specialized sigma24 family protein